MKTHPSWLNAARLAWIGIAAFGLGILLTSFPPEVPDGSISDQAHQELAQLGLANLITDAMLARTAMVLSAILIAGYVAAAAILFWRSTAWEAILFSTVVLALGVTNGVITDHPNPGPLLRAFEILTDFLSLLILYTFPDGRLVPRWSAALLIPWLAILIGNQMDILPGDATEDIFDLIFIGTGILAQTYRYRAVSTPAQQQQAKWVVLGIAIIVAVIYPLELARGPVRLLLGPDSLGVLTYEVIRAFARTLVQLLLPLVIAIAVLRYRLWDIDFYIHRSLVYGSLTVVLGLAFFGSALLLQAIAQTATGGAPSALVLTASSVLVAILFQPVRQRLQHFIDRRFYGIELLPVQEAASHAAAPQPLIEPLGPREMDVLCLIDAGLSNRDIADQLFITVGTVKWHTNNIYTKLGVSSRTQALARARELHLFP